MRQRDLARGDAIQGDTGGEHQRRRENQTRQQHRTRLRSRSVKHRRFEYERKPRLAWSQRDAGSLNASEDLAPVQIGNGVREPLHVGERDRVYVTRSDGSTVNWVFLIQVTTVRETVLDLARQWRGLRPKGTIQLRFDSMTANKIGIPPRAR